ncbi:hypothetical protein CRG98_007883 [Punica granatum]|uniref:Uncharacterized protein n=1 Tax=Punica granatum TaxID=22663 RepID=A0A2I0KTU9_PUNGR|nr:hypothetical protein CRG98_007883 [Punica granatum]
MCFRCPWRGYLIHIARWSRPLLMHNRRFGGAQIPNNGACSNNGVGPVCGLKPGTWEWVGRNTSSVIAEWDLVCDREFLAAVPASLFFIGSLLVSFYQALLFMVDWRTHGLVYAFLRFTNGFARSGIAICCLGDCGFFFFTAGFLSLPAIAYPTRTQWRNMYRIISTFRHF